MFSQKCPKVQKCVKKEGFHSIGALGTCRESQFLPYAGFLFFCLQNKDILKVGPLKFVLHNKENPAHGQNLSLLYVIQKY